jgi:hypothetical protein
MATTETKNNISGGDKGNSYAFRWMFKGKLFSPEDTVKISLPIESAPGDFNFFFKPGYTGNYKITVTDSNKNLEIEGTSFGTGDETDII